MNSNVSNPQLELLRSQMDTCNEQILDLFQKRMDVVGKIADLKLKEGMRVCDPARERQIITDMHKRADDDYKSFATVLFSLLIEVSNAYQERLIHPTSRLKESIDTALASTPKLFPPHAHVACQGVEGAYSQLACERLFKHPEISFFKTFDAVFSAVDAGLCEYGVLPIENSSAGSVNAVYDLMMNYDFYITRTCRFKVDHDLLALPNASLDTITEVFSHEQAISQCSRFLEAHPSMKVTPVANTAAAARMVAESGRADVAALCGRSCADLYGLKVLSRQVNDSDNNYTRFACITKNLQIFPGADKTSLMVVLPHEPGSLYKALARFYALDINLTKLQSRPILGRDFEFMFYFDLDTPVYAPEFSSLICELDSICDEFKYLGSYSEMI